MVQLSHPCMTGGKTITFTIGTFVVREVPIMVFNFYSQFLNLILPCIEAFNLILVFCRFYLYFQNMFSKLGYHIIFTNIKYVYAITDLCLLTLPYDPLS